MQYCIVLSLLWLLTCLLLSPSSIFVILLPDVRCVLSFSMHPVFKWCSYFIVLISFLVLLVIDNCTVIVLVTVQYNAYFLVSLQVTLVLFLLFVTLLAVLSTANVKSWRCHSWLFIFEVYCHSNTIQRDLQSHYVLYSMFSHLFWVIVGQVYSRQCIFDCRSLQFDFLVKICNCFQTIPVES